MRIPIASSQEYIRTPISICGYVPVVVEVGAGNVQICKAVRSDGQIPPGEGAVGPDQRTVS
jgi:hypothetical protein